MKNFILTTFFIIIFSTAFAGGDMPENNDMPQQGLIHKHIPKLFSFAAINMPEPKEGYEYSKKSDGGCLAKAYELKQLFHKKFTDDTRFKDREHFWLASLKKPVRLGYLRAFVHDKEIAQSIIGHTDTPNSMALLCAARWGNMSAVQKHFNKNIHTKTDPELGLTSLGGLTPLNLAFLFSAENGHTDLVKLLLHLGANIHEQGDCALVQAVANGYNDIVQHLIEQGANVHARDDFIPIYAANNGQTETLQLLLKFGVDINIHNSCPLRVASQNGHTDTVQFLLDNGADVHRNNDISLIHAVLNGHYETTLVLLDHGANIHEQNDRVLKFAATKGFTNIVQLLLTYGANSNAIDEATLKKISDNGHTEVVQLLLNHLDATQN